MSGLMPSFPAAGSAQRAGAGNSSGRNKVALGRGRSLMDWIRLGNSGKDLTGVGGKRVEFTMQEVSKHNTVKDCWTVLAGKVYNLTQYLEFHPGGVDELMKAAGIDGTRLFVEIHKWVNFESMLAKCYIGPLKADHAFAVPSLGNRLTVPKAQPSPLTGNSLAVNSTSLLVGTKLSTSLLVGAGADAGKPRYDFLENEKNVVLSIYARAAAGRLLPDCVIAGLTPQNWTLKIRIYLKEEAIYQFCMELSKPVLENFEIKINTKTGKVDVKLFKKESGVMWTKLGDPGASHDVVILPDEIDASLDLWSCEVSSITSVTHDTYLYGLTLPQCHFMSVPVGKHVQVHGSMEGISFTRSYTPVDWLSTGKDGIDLPFIKGDLFLMIKIYEDGVLTQEINKLGVGDHMLISGAYYGSFDVESSLMEASVTECVLLAAGTGFTPMVKLTKHALSMNDIRLSMFFFNKTEEDILWRKELEEFAAQHPDRFTVAHVLSKAEKSWSGLRGHITKDILSQNLINVETNTNRLYCVCGPKPFVTSVIRCLDDLGIPKQNVWLFDG